MIARVANTAVAAAWRGAFVQQLTHWLAALRATPVGFAAKPVGPSNRAKASGSKCLSCGAALVPGHELGAEAMSCGRCGYTFERAGG